MEALLLRSNSEEETIAVGVEFAERLRVGDVVALYGDLGAGKTEFIKGVCAYFQVEGLVTSPTFTIINQYNGVTNDGTSVKIYHVDLYRIETDEELAGVGFDDMVFSHDAIKLIEWSEKAEHLLPTAHYTVRIMADDENDSYRTIEITAPTTDIQGIVS
ncbi:tRNA (adenosine(37)-N6)-threonylcarbamoyltransferase complex ATPase subunit type 1 TsaE [soil metagenome]